METKFMFNGQVYDTREDAEDAVFRFARTVYDDVLDECYDEIYIGNFSYSPSYVLKRVDETAYRCGLNDYADSLLYDIEEIENDEIEYED